MQCLTQKEARVVRAIGQTLYPRGNQLGIDGIDAQVAEYFDGYMAAIPLWERTKIRALLYAIEYAPVAGSLDRARTFTEGNVSQRLEYLEAWERSSVTLRRMAFKALRYLMALAYIASGVVAHEIGIEDPASLGTPEQHLRDLANLNLSDLGAAE